MKKTMHLCVLIFISLGFMACEKDNLDSEMLQHSADLSVNTANLVKITATGHAFDAPDEIPSGWTTFKFMNKSHGVHFFLLEKMPAGKTLDSSRIQVTPAFQAGLDFYRAGDFAEAFGPNGFGAIPDWYAGVTFTGGSGLIGPNKTSISTVNLEPGTYLIECYVKGQNGNFHSFEGMMDQIIVTEENNRRKEPKANIDLSISSTNGITLNDEIRRPGKHTFSVFFEDQSLYQTGLGHDVHLIKYNNGFNEKDRAIMNLWVNWIFVDFSNSNVISEGLMEPAPAGISFLGGMQELPAGQTGYFNAVLTPGDYAFIAEVDDPLGKNLYFEFTID